MKPTRFVIRDAESIQYIRDNISKMTIKKIARKLGCSESLVHVACNVNNIENPRSRKRKVKAYSVEEIKQYLRDNPNVEAKEVSKMFKCDHRYIYDYRSQIEDEKLASKISKMRAFFNNAPKVIIRPKNCSEVDELFRYSNVGLIALKQLEAGTWEIDFENGRKLKL